MVPSWRAVCRRLPSHHINQTTRQNVSFDEHVSRLASTLQIEGHCHACEGAHSEGPAGWPASCRSVLQGLAGQHSTASLGPVRQLCYCLKLWSARPLQSSPLWYAFPPCVALAQHAFFERIPSAGNPSVLPSSTPSQLHHIPSMPLLVLQRAGGT